MSNYVCLGCYSRVGKDTFGSMLQAEMAIASERVLGCQINVAKLALAYELKTICYMLYKWAGHQEPEYYDTPEGIPFRDVKLPVLNLTPVELWVRFGTHAIRCNVYDLTWVRSLIEVTASADVTIVTDLRFRNECDEFSRHGAFFIKVVRPGVSPRNTIADNAIDENFQWDALVCNDGDLNDLRRKAATMAPLILEEFFDERTIKTSQQ